VKVLLNEKQLHAGVAEVAAKIQNDYQDRPVTIIAIMTGSLIFLADLVRRLEMPIRISLIQASSYRGGTSSGDLQISQSMMLDIAGRDCILVDDIFDTGKTLLEVGNSLRALNPKSLRSAVLLHKLGQSKVELVPDYIAFAIPNEFVVGYGLDYDDHYRNLPYVGVMEASDLAS
jgi:hypoxanthine phosphoribosyltransferase